MKNIYALFVMLVATVAVNAQTINFPDASFKATLVMASPSVAIAKNAAGNNMTVDTSGDGEIQISEALAVHELDLRNMLTNVFPEIADLNGLSSFTNLRKLNLGWLSNVPTLDLSLLTNLEWLDMFSMQLTSIDVSGLGQLRYLGVAFMPITSLDLTGCPLLEELHANDNNLISLDISNLANLHTLYVGGFYSEGSAGVLMDSLNAANCTALQTIDFGMFNQRHVNLSGCTALTVLTALQSWDISGAYWETLDLSGSAVAYVGITSTPALQQLNLSGCTQLTQVVAFENSLNTINLSGCAALTTLNATDNPLQNLNLDGCSALDFLYVPGHQLSSLDLSSCTALIEADLWQGTLTSLNLTGLNQLHTLLINGNQLTSLDLSMLPNLTQIDCRDNQLEYLNLKNGSIETSLALSNNPNLAFICVDDQQWVSVQASALATTVVSPYCTFVPGGSYNTITGTVKLDTDGNGCGETFDLPPYVRVEITDGATTGSAFTNNAGLYTAYRYDGNFTITPRFEVPAAFSSNPIAANVSFASASNLAETRDFCVTPNPMPDLEVVISSVSAVRPSMNYTYTIILRNKGSEIQSGTLTFAFDDSLMDVIAVNPANATVSNGQILFNFSDLRPLQNLVFTVSMAMNGVTSTPPLNEGDVLSFTASVPVSDAEMTPNDNTMTLRQIVINSLDPNDKTCLQGETISPANIGEYLYYNINFENIGTAEAINVVVRDVINSQQFDVESLQLIYASHPVQARLNGNIIEFIFQNINLPSSILDPIGGHGNVLFKIRTLSTLQPGEMVSNTANIFFDYNHPIATNEARTTFAELKRNEFGSDSSIALYPNPAKDLVSIQADSSVKSIELFDLQGRILQHTSENKKAMMLDVSGRPDGIYFLRITTAKGSAVKKLVKQ